LETGVGEPQQAWAFIAEFAAAWTAPLGPGDGVGEEALRAAEERIGAALRDAYLLFGQRRDLTAVQDRLLPPRELAIDNEGTTLVFRTENQHCAAWGITAADLGSADPPVYVRHRDGWQPHLDRVSTACVDMVLSEVLLGRKHLGDMCALPAELITTVEAVYDQLPVAEYPLWGDRNITVRYFSAPGTLLRMDGRGPYCWLITGCQTTTALEATRAAIPAPWTAMHWPGKEP
jgi:hypothetical protein